MSEKEDVQRGSLNGEDKRVPVMRLAYEQCCSPPAHLRDVSSASRTIKYAILPPA